MFSLRSLLLSVVIVSTSVISACSVGPSVRYWVEPTRDEKGYIKFYLSSTDITLSKRNVSDSKTEAKSTVGVTLNSTVLDIPSESVIGQVLEEQVKVTLTPAEHRKNLYAIIPQDSWLGSVQTRLSVTYFETHDTPNLIKEIGSEVQDDRVKAIAAIGAVARGIAPITGFAEEPEPKLQLHLPLSINSHAARDGQWRTLPRNSGWWYKLAIGERSKSSLEILEFFARHNVNGGVSTAAFPLPSCRTGNLHLKYHRDRQSPSKEEQGDATFNIMFADPDFVDTLQLPAKGAIKMHSVCGADLVSQPATVANGWALVEELMKQVKAIKDQQTKTKK